MAPLSQATRCSFSHVKPDKTHVYKGIFDSEWVLGAVAHGGVVLGCMMAAACHHQSLPVSSSYSRPFHPDPVHLNSLFLSPTSAGPYEVHIKTLSASKRWTRLDIDFLQIDPTDLIVRVRVHLMFSTLESPSLPEPVSPTSLTLLANTPSEFAPLCPLRYAPQECDTTPMFDEFRKRGRVRIHEREGMLAPGEGLQWGGWIELSDDGEDLTADPALLVFFSDIFRNGVMVLPEGQQPPETVWFATMTLTVEFKAKLPLAPTRMSETKSGTLSKRTVGTFATTRFLHAGRHTDNVEVWSAPSLIGEKVHEEGSDEWRKESQILLVASQMAILLPSRGKQPSKSPEKL